MTRRNWFRRVSSFIVGLVFLTSMTLTLKACGSSPPGMIGQEIGSGSSNINGTSGGSNPDGPLVRFSDGDQLDGTPFETGGSPITFRAACTLRDGSDASNSITWLNKQRQVIGTGPELTFNFDQVGNFTIFPTCSDQEGRIGTDPISFTVSPPGVKIAPHVKVSESPDAFSSLVEFNPDANRVCFRDDRVLDVHLLRNDVVILYGKRVEVGSQPTVSYTKLENEFIPPFRLGDTATRSGDTVCFSGGEYPGLEEIILDSGEDPINFLNVDINPRSDELISPVIEGVIGENEDFNLPVTGLRQVSRVFPREVEEVQIPNP